MPRDSAAGFPGFLRHSEPGNRPRVVTAPAPPLCGYHRVGSPDPRIDFKGGPTYAN